jgi:hypothetical protein
MHRNPEGRKLALRIDDHSDAGTVALQKPPPPAESYSPSNLWIATQSRHGTQVKKPFISTESTSRPSPRPFICLPQMLHYP